MMKGHMNNKPFAIDSAHNQTFKNNCWGDSKLKTHCGCLIGADSATSVIKDIMGHKKLASFYRTVEIYKLYMNSHALTYIVKCSLWSKVILLCVIELTALYYHNIWNV